MKFNLIKTYQLTAIGLFFLGIFINVGTGDERWLLYGLIAALTMGVIGSLFKIFDKVQSKRKSSAAAKDAQSS